MSRMSDDRQSREVAVAAARLMQEQGLDYLTAKKKAALKLGLGARAALPTNRQIEDALLENQRLFFNDDAKAELQQLRETALIAMDCLRAFEPKLVGTVLGGAITTGAAVELHAFTDSTEAVAVSLIDADIDYRLSERRLRFRTEQYVLVPVYSFDHGDVEIDVYVFDVIGQRQSPLSPVDGKPMTRASANEVKELLEQSSASVVDDFFS
ncbi:MAG: hypothetical protein AB8G18_03175 [Gammaproteobacteria bacterium]